MERLKTFTEAAEILGVGGDTLFTLLNYRKIPYVLITPFAEDEAFWEGAAQGDARIDPKDLKDFIDKSKHAGVRASTMDGAEAAFPKEPLFRREDDSTAKPKAPGGLAGLIAGLNSDVTVLF